MEEGDGGRKREEEAGKEVGREEAGRGKAGERTGEPGGAAGISSGEMTTDDEVREVLHKLY